MSKDETYELINQSMYTLMKFTRKSRGPIKTFRMRDLHLLKFIYFECEDHKTTMTNLSKFLNISPAASSQIITSYEKKGWVKRERSEQDRRTIFVCLTDSTRKLLEDKWLDHQKKVMTFLEDLTEEEFNCLTSILNKIIYCMEKE